MRVRNRLVRSVAFPVMFRPDTRRDDLVRLGSDYGGWIVPRSGIGPGSVCYCGGVGTDISFDLALIATFGCRVWAFDPTPRSIEWVRAQELDDRFTMVPVGIAGEGGELRFYSPENAEQVSHSVKNIQRTSTFFTATVATLAGLMAELGHDTVDLVKLDIEGAEHDAIRRMLADGVRPRVLCVEFDQPEPLSWGRATAAALRSAGYDLVAVEGLNLTFVRRGR
jgi:FkbM family methyltransferase